MSVTSRRDFIRNSAIAATATAADTPASNGQPVAPVDAGTL